MAEFSYARMEKHRKYVLNNIKTLLAHKKNLMESLDLSEDQFNDFSNKLLQRAEQHDLSKYSEPEKIAYIYLNWKCDQEKTYSKKYKYPEGIEKMVKQPYNTIINIIPIMPTFIVIKRMVHQKMTR